MVFVRRLEPIARVLPRRAVLFRNPLGPAVARDHASSFEGVYRLSEKGREGSNNGIYGYSFQEEIYCL